MIDRSPRWAADHARHLVLGVAGLILVVHSLAYNFVTDDAYISFVYSRNFAEHGELTFNLGDHVEGYTNFSWTVVLGLLMKLGISPELSSRVLGTGCALATLYVVMRTMERALGNKSAWTAVPSLLLACSSGFACWTSGGLETQLFTLLVAGALDGVVAAAQQPAALRRAAVCLALAAMTRPEGPLIAAVLGAVWVGHRVLIRRDEIAIASGDGALPSKRILQGLALACAGVCAGCLAGGVTLLARWDAFTTGSGLSSALALVVAVLAIGVPLLGLYASLQVARGALRGLTVTGCMLAVLGAGYLAAAIRTGHDLDDAIRWQHAIPTAMVAIPLAAVCLGLRIAIRAPWPRLSAELFAALWFLALWLPWFLWRWWYYGYPFPNTYYVKASGNWSSPDYGSIMVSNGFYYVWRWMLDTHVLYASPLLLLGLVARPKTARFVLAAACGVLIGVYLAYTITVGGDFMGLHRFIMPVFVLVAIAIVLGLERLAQSIPAVRVVFPGSLPALIGLVLIVGALATFVAFHLRDDSRVVPMLVVAAVGTALAIGRLSRAGLAIAACALLIGTFATTQIELTQRSLDPKNLAADHGVIDTPAFLIVYTEDRAKIGKAMAPCFTDDDFSIVGGAGAQPYYGNMRGIDVFGLVSDKIAHREPRSRPRAGHTKWGSDSLLAEYNPDFVFSCYRIHREPSLPTLPCAGPWLRQGFEQVTVKVEGMREQGEYYTFLAKKSRNFQCPIRIH